MPIVIAPLLVGFAVLATGFVLLSMHHTMQAWLRPFIDELAHPRGNFIKKVAYAQLSLITRAVGRIEHRVGSAISHAAASRMVHLAKWIGGLVAFVLVVPRELERLGDTIADAMARLVSHTIPRAIHRETKPIDARAKAAQKSANRSISLTQRNTKRLLKNISALAGTVALTKLLAQKGIDILRNERVVPRIKANEKAIDTVRGRDIPSIKTRLKRIEKALALGLIAGIVLRTLARVAPWLFCRNVKKVGNTLCALNSDVLDDLLLITTVAVGSISIVELAKELQGVVGAASDGVHGFITDD